MNTSPLVSIALCTYNGSKYLPLQLDSILNQSYHNTEIVIVDDSSTDSTYEILTSYQLQYPSKIRLYRNEKNLGFVKNFEKAISLCQGTMIALSDQDDLWDYDKIAILLENIKDNMLIYHDSLMINESGASLDHTISGLKNMYSGASPLPFLFNNCVSGHSILMKRELVKDILPFPKEIFYDWWIAFKATQAGSISYVDRPLVHYRQHEGTITSPTLTAKSEDHIVSTNLSILKVLASTENLKYADLISRIEELVGMKNEQLFHFRLFEILFKHQDELFFISKKSKASKLNRIIKNIWSKNLHI